MRKCVWPGHRGRCWPASRTCSSHRSQKSSLASSGTASVPSGLAPHQADGRNDGGGGRPTEGGDDVYISGGGWGEGVDGMFDENRG